MELTPPNLSSVRADLERDIAVRVDESLSQRGIGAATPAGQTILANTTVNTFGAETAHVTAIYGSDAITVEVTLPEEALPISRTELTTRANSNDTVALSDIGGEPYDEYETTLINTIATEFGREYSGRDRQAILNRDAETLVYTGDNHVDRSVPNEYAFCCRLDPGMFWDIE